jgi:hypothetical protein
MATDVESQGFHLTRRAGATASAPAPAERPAATAAGQERIGLVGMLFGGLAAVLLLGLAATFVGLAGFAVVKGIDVLYAAEHLVEHWSDERTIPPNAELCKGLFCRRADTTPKHVSGSVNRQTENFAAFCPDHGRPEYLFFLDFSVFGTMVWFAFGVCVLLSAVLWSSLGIGAALAVVGSPVLLAVGGERRRRLLDLGKSVAVTLGLIVGGAASFAYIWW